MSRPFTPHEEAWKPAQKGNLTMDARQLNETASAMVAGNKGLLAMDESTPTANKRFAASGIPQNEETPAPTAT